MVGESNVNMVISQGNAVKEVYNVKKQNLEVQQQAGMQEHIKNHRKKKVKIQKTENNTKIQVKGDEKREDQGHLAKREEENNEEQNQTPENKSDSSFIDIIV